MAADLTVVLITRNQEWNVPRLVESVLGHTASVKSREVILVDSASTDRTVELACAYPIDAIRLSPDQRLTASIGRYVGYQNTTGKLVLFLDGDMELIDGWMDKALAVMDKQSDIAVITGPLIDRPLEFKPGDPPPPGEPPLRQGDALEVIPHGGGAAMYRRAVLEQVGNFNVELYSDEEPELCIRIRQEGYKVVMLDHTLAYHYSQPMTEISTLFARRKRNLYYGYGQNIRNHLTDGLLWPYVRERGYGLIPGVGLLAGLALLALSILSGRWYGFGVWLLLFALMIVADSLRRRSVYKALFALTQRLVIMEGTFWGIFMKPRDPSKFTAQYEVVKRSGQP